MSNSYAGIYSFVADTCILVVIAYLLARGRFLALLFREKLEFRQAATLGVVLGLIGLTEAVFPDARFPYAAHTLFVTFAAIVGGLGVGLITASLVTIGAFFFQGTPLVVGTMLAIVVSALLGRSVRRLESLPTRLLAGLVVGCLAQACRLLINIAVAKELNLAILPANFWISAPANGFGVMLLLLVASDAQVRAESERRRLDAERSHALASEAQLTALRARMHPHFLFNAHNSIAALCSVSPDRARSAILRLSHLMRRALEMSGKTTVCLGEEIDAVRTYLEVEQERFGPRLSIMWKVEPAAEQTPVPPFAVQTLVENAVNHGIAPSMDAGELTITVRRRHRHVFVAVRDNGVGMSRCSVTPSSARPHGLNILSQQLVLLYGRSARLRLFSRKNVGTLAAFKIPSGHNAQRPGVITG